MRGAKFMMTEKLDGALKTVKRAALPTEEAEGLVQQRSFFDSLPDSNDKKACVSILQFIGTTYNLRSLAWIEPRGNHFEVVGSTGKIKNQPLYPSIPASDARLLEAAKKESAIKLLVRQKEPADVETQTVWLFPVLVGKEIRSGLLIGDQVANENKRRRIARFCRTAATEMEIRRLRKELSQSRALARAVKKFNENVQLLDSEDFWLNLVQIFAELMKAERVSLMIFDEKSGSLIVKAAIESSGNAIKNEKNTFGDHVARRILRGGKPILPSDAKKNRTKQPLPGRKYKSESSVSYPIEIGARKIGVLNFAGQTDGENYSEFDLNALDTLMPQLAVLIDRADLKHKAGELEHLSITDPLTGLLNRRYLEERLAEEINQSSRHDFPMSFMMIDVDDFKSYNDRFSHPEGDQALKIIADCLKETVRASDIAARYGGEEFSILLPQTTAVEARIIAERLRRRVAATDFPSCRVTVSIGVAGFSPTICTALDIIKAADEALYEAKRRGRDNVQIFDNFKNMN